MNLNVDTLHFNEEEIVHGKSVHLKNFPKGHRLKLFRLALGTERTEYVVTNDLTQVYRGCPTHGNLKRELTEAVRK